MIRGLKHSKVENKFIIHSSIYKGLKAKEDIAGSLLKNTYRHTTLNMSLVIQKIHIHELLSRSSITKNLSLLSEDIWTTP